MRKIEGRLSPPCGLSFSASECFDQPVQVFLMS
jgi:hypothetical protein